MRHIRTEMMETLTIGLGNHKNNYEYFVQDAKDEGDHDDKVFSVGNESQIDIAMESNEKQM